MTTKTSENTTEHHRREEELASEKRRRQTPFHLPNFSLDTAFHYYAIMRMLGYFYETTFSDLAKHTVKKTRPASQPAVVGVSAGNHASYLSVKDNDSTAMSADDFSPSGHSRVTGGQKSDAQPLATELVALKHEEKKHAFRLMEKVEALSFMSWTAYNFYKERKETISAFADVAAAEHGLDPKDVGINKINKCENPFIVTATDKFMWQTVSRAATDSLFFVGVKHGIIGKALSITLERSVFFNRTASENLKGLIEEAGWNNLGSIGKQELVRNLIKVTQQCCKENHYSSLTESEIRELNPVFNRVAEQIVQKKFGFQEAVYILGDVVREPNKPQKIMQCLENVETLGLYGIASQKHAEKGLGALPDRPEKHDASHGQKLAPSFVDIVAAGKKGEIPGRPFGYVGGRMV